MASPPPSATRWNSVGAHGEVTRVELSSALIDSDARRPCCSRPWRCCRKPRRHRSDRRGRVPWRLSMPWAKASSRWTPAGRIDYINTAADHCWVCVSTSRGKSFPEVASLVDEADRRSLGDPVRMALIAGGRWSMVGAPCSYPPTAAPNGPSNSASRR